MKINCWEWKLCAKEHVGVKTEKTDICPAAGETRLNGANNGINGGRACWVIGKTLGDGEVQKNFPRKLAKCLNCNFYYHVIMEEGRSYKDSDTLLEIIHGDNGKERFKKY